MEYASVRMLLGGVIDYAGLFPPAARSMAGAQAEYDAARRGPDAWMLGRFVVPAARLDEWTDVRAHLGPRAAEWRLSAIVRPRSEEDRSAVERCNAEAPRHDARVDAVECRVDDVEGIDWLAGAFNAGIDAYAEVPLGPAMVPLLNAIAARGVRAKVRTGGLTADAFPAPEALAAFLDTVVRLGLPFKATAGLHHAVRGAYPLSYEPAAPRGTMYGYLNVLLATAALQEGAGLPLATEILSASTLAPLTVEAGALRWGALHVRSDALRLLRTEAFVSFGSCSFIEPAAEASALTASATTPGA